MLKRILSLATAFCALCCMLPTALTGALASANTYYIEVDIANQITTVYRKADRTIVRQMICSTGTGNRTPRGTFKLQKTRESTDRKSWYYISKYHCYVKYATRIKGGILFHSIPYTDKNMDSIDKKALAELGSKASHGCIRLRWQDAKWIALNCPDGTTVKIFTGAAKKPSLRKLLLKEGYTADCGLSYEQFLATDFAADGAGGMGRGSSGEKVSALQRRLIGLGFYSGEESGEYDNATIVAVMRYQAAAGITVNGVASKALIQRIMAEEDLAAEYSTLVPGITGPLVAKFQAAMDAVGFYTGGVDGIYNAALSKAMSVYAQCMRLEDDQKITPAIRADVYNLLERLNKRFGQGNFSLLLLDEAFTSATTKQKTPLYAKASSSSKKLTTVPKATSVTFIEKGKAWCKVQYGKQVGFISASKLKLKDVKRPVPHWGIPVEALCEVDMNASSQGDGVIALQQRLKDLGFFTGESTPLYDDATAEAVKVYQSTAGLKITGEATVELQQAILGSDEITGIRVTLSHGMNSPAVAALQRTLRALQYYSGPCAGKFNSATARAVKLFTRTNGMAETAIATPEVQQAVFDQYLDCEQKYGSGNYVLSFATVETRMATAREKTTLYKKDTARSKSVATMKKGDEATVLREGETWCKLSFDGRTGYAMTRDLKRFTRVEEVAVFNAPLTPNPASIVYGEESIPEAPVATDEAEDGLTTDEDAAVPFEGDVEAVDGESNALTTELDLEEEHPSSPVESIWSDIMASVSAIAR